MREIGNCHRAAGRTIVPCRTKSGEEKAAMAVHAPNLQRSIERAHAIAKDRHDEEATLVHLLLALTDDPDAGPVMHACDVNLDTLRLELIADLESARDHPIAKDKQAASASGFERVIRKAKIYAQSAGRDVVTSGHVLVAVLDEMAGQFLQQHGMTRYDAVNYISHGIAKGTTPDLEPARFAVPDPKSNDGAPLMFKVLMLNDDYTPMDFVVSLLQQIFGKDHEEAMKIMLAIHRDGSGVCGLYERADARGLAAQVMERARVHHHPLRCVIARADAA